MLRIGELARIAGVTPRLLRHYEAVGVLVPAFISRTRYRYYDLSQVAALQQILAYRDAGVPLADIAGFSVERQREVLKARRAVVDRQLASLDAMAAKPFRVKRTPPFWTASVRRTVETYAAAELMMRDLRAALAADESTPSAAVWHECRPEDGRIDCELQVVFARPSRNLCRMPSQLVVTFAHTGPDSDLPTIYREMHVWSRAARYRHCGPLREVYWSGVTEVQFPVC